MTLSVRHLINTTELAPSDISQILDCARTFEEVNQRTIKKVPALRGRTVVNLFLEPSTRTRSSFEIAEKRLSADSLSSYGVDLFVCRARNAGTPQMITRYTDAHVINAGDGKHAHPTQALLDLYTMREHFGHLEGLKVAIVGDLLHSRVVGSLAPALRTMGAEVTLVGPPTFQLADPSALGATETYDFDPVIPDADVVYMLRVQLERMEGATIPSRREYNRLWGLTDERHARMKEGSIVMHPGPMNRGMEIAAGPADAANSFVTRQVASGLYVRMAAMYLLLGGE